MNHRCFAVIHVHNYKQALKNCDVAARAGFDGVFLISHGELRFNELAGLLWPCRQLVPYVGVNFLDLPIPSIAIEYALCGFYGVWTDQTFLADRPSFDERLGIEVFSGFAFKHQQQPASTDDLISGAQEAILYCDVLTTSGPATGQPASVEKLRTIRGAIGDHRLAVASGVTAENVRSFMPYVNDFLVATGINGPTDDIDPDKAARLLEAMR